MQGFLLDGYREPLRDNFLFVCLGGGQVRHWKYSKWRLVVAVPGTLHEIRRIRCLSFRRWVSKSNHSRSTHMVSKSGCPLVRWQLALFATLGANPTLPKWNAFESLRESDLFMQCWVRQITPKSKGEKIQNLNLSCRIKVRFKSGRIIKGFGAQVFFQRGKRTKESSLLK